MLYTILFALWSASGLLSHSRACPFHRVQSEDAPLLNRRSSPPGDCAITAIEDVRVFNGKDFSVPQTVCLDSGWIVSLDGCDNAEIKVNGTGKFLLPGLIDNHIHLTDVQSLENFTSYGCTTAMHMNCRNYTQCDIMAHQPGLASFIYAGRSAVGNGSLHEKQDPTRPKDTLIYPDTNVTQFVEWQFGNGSNFHKITAEINGPSIEQQTEMVRTTHCQFHAQTMTHASDMYSYSQAIQSRTDGIQHLPDDGLLDNAMIQTIKAQNQFITPTINIFKYGFEDAALQQYFGLQSGSNASLTNVETNVKKLYQAGIPMVAGTDSVGSLVQNGTTVVTVPFGLTLHYELQNLVNIAGMSPAEAINAATREGAKWHRVPDRGTIEIGKRADLLMLNSDPLQNITNTLDIEKVWVFGIEVAMITKLS